VVQRRQGRLPPGREGRVHLPRELLQRRTHDRAGRNLYYNFRLLLTPFKPLDTAAHFSTRYFHAFKPADEVVQQGANVVNVHHANSINPYINYPFFRPAEMKAYIDRAHASGCA